MNWNLKKLIRVYTGKCSEKRVVQVIGSEEKAKRHDVFLRIRGALKVY